ncbi:RNA polymerase Rpo13 [Metallosphaera tengchongensis]|uniref:RNA polymerase Rpo13 n=1 Tax=Metallosphaera tengchongensis TaxID=1532350 RepID=A0A6N0NVY9_9CREN|nr:RNA polymerase subunit Rpo13 [Metallosphaera tengchongensis]QKQ99818.1 RNA polymerase Rpo13 [Metallosphaera tengchongensis]
MSSSDDYEEENEIQSAGSEDEKIETEDEEDGIPALSLQDIELLTKNTEVWYKLISGKISLEEAEKEFNSNFSSYQTKPERRKSRSTKSKTQKKAKKMKKKKEEEDSNV